MDVVVNSYLTKIDQQAQGITGQFKAENAMERVCKMNNIRACAMELVNAEIICAEAKADTA